LENARLFPSWSSFSRLKKKPGYVVSVGQKSYD
jgi:hypothetical protein